MEKTFNCKTITDAFESEPSAFIVWMYGVLLEKDGVPSKKEVIKKKFNIGEHKWRTIISFLINNGFAEYSYNSINARGLNIVFKDSDR